MSLKVHILSLEELLLKYPVLDVPNFQRTFKWEPDFVADLFSEIINGLNLSSKDTKSKDCFLGSVVVCEDNETGRFDLVDGQQRLTTLSILIACLSHKTSKSHSRRIREILRQSDKNSEPRILHKKGNSNICSDRDAFIEVALNDEPNLAPHNTGSKENDKELNYEWSNSLKNNLIYKAYGRLSTECAKTITDRARDISDSPDETKTAGILLDRILTGVKLISIETKEKKEGMRIFASINAGGTKLEPWELIMSAFYTHSKNNDHTQLVDNLFQQGTHSLQSYFGDKRGQEKPDIAKNGLLRSYWLATHRFERMDDLFDEYNNSISDKKGSIDVYTQTLDHLRALIPFYASFNDPKSWKSNDDNKISYELSFLHPLMKILGEKLARPPLLAIALKFHHNPRQLEEAMNRAAFAFERARIRLSMCAIGSNFLEKRFSDLALQIYKGKAGDNPIEVEKYIYSFLKDLNGFPAKDQLRSAFKKFDALEKDRLTKLIVSRLNHAMLNPNEKENWYLHTPEPGKTGFTTEQGIKLTIGQVNEDLAVRNGFKNQGDCEKYIQSIGNIFLIPSGSVRITPSTKFNEGVQLSSFNADELKERLDRLTEVALDVWHF